MLTNALLSRREMLGLMSAAAISAYRPETARGYFANDTINVACLGTGGRCRHLMERLAPLEGVRIAGVCDIWDAHRAQAKSLADARAIEEVDFRKMLERPEIDAVLIGSPDHWHVPMTIAACAAGKDVYVEKPLTHTIEEGQPVIDAVRTHKRVVQIGTQQRSLPHLIEAKSLIQQGALGQVHKIHMSWNRNTPRWVRTQYGIDPNSVRWDLFLGNAPKQPFDEYRFRNWRWFWDFGGGILTDLMVHWLDTANWLLDLPPVQHAVTIGHQFAAQDVWETPDSIQTLLDFGEQGPQAHFDGTFVNHYGRAELVLMGREATLQCDRGGFQIIPQRGSKATAVERFVSKNPLRGLDFYDDVEDGRYHLQNWVDSMRTRKDPSCPVEAAVQSAAGAHLANLALSKRSK